MLTRNECGILSIKTCVHFKCNIEIDLNSYVHVRTCEKRVTDSSFIVIFLNYHNFKYLTLQIVDVLAVI